MLMGEREIYREYMVGVVVVRMAFFCMKSGLSAPLAPSVDFGPARWLSEKGAKRAKSNRFGVLATSILV